MTARTRGLIALASVIVAVVLLVWQRLFLNGMWVWFRVNWWAVLLVVLALVCWGSMAGTKHKRVLGISACLAVVLAIAGLVVTPYLRASTYFTASVQVSDPTTTPDYQPRAPYVVARASMASKVDTNGYLADTTYLADRDAFTGPIAVDSLVGGYYTKVVEQRIDLATGDSTTTSCEFDRETAGRRLNGRFGSSLERAVVAKAGFGTIINDRDAYAYCDGDTPVVVVPLQRVAGFFPAYYMQAGIAMYDGATGEVTIVREVVAGEVPGPVYPISLAQTQRASTAAQEGFFRYLSRNAGFGTSEQDSGSEDDGEDEDATSRVDANRGNTAEFNLALADGSGSEYVSDLSRRGRGTRVVALGRMPSDTVTSGTLTTLEVGVLAQDAQRDSNTAVEDRIREQNQELPWASGIQVFEIAPLEDGKWAATIGLSQALSYRVVYDVFTGSSSVVRIGQGAASGGTGAGESQTGGTTTAPGDLGGLTDEELADLNEAIADEIARRLSGGS